MKVVILSCYKVCLADLRHLLSPIAFISFIYDHRGGGLKAFHFMASLLESWSLNEGEKFMRVYVAVELVVKKEINSVIPGHMMVFPVCIWRILLFH